MATRTILIMIGALCLATAEDTDQYPYSYDIHPRLLVKSFNQSQENGTHLTFCCQVSSEETELAKYNFSIEWHHIDHNSESMLYSIISSKIEDIENTIISSTNQTQITTPEWNITENRTLEWSKLTIHIQQKKDTGYYWCSVKFNDNGTMFVPSTVLNISSVGDIQLQICKCDHNGPIVNGLLFSKFRCASGNVSEMEPQSNECQQVNQDEMPPSTSTATVEDLETTTPSEIGTDNGSTTGEGAAESLTDLSTKFSSTTQEMTVTVETMTDSEKEHDDTTQATYAPDTEGPTTAEIPRRDQLDKIMLNFIVAIATAAVLSLILLLCLIIGICLRKLSKMRGKRPKQQAVHATTISTPVDVYNMTTKTKLVCKESAAMSSSFMCEPNTSYDVTPGTTTAPSLEHVYDCIP